MKKKLFILTLFMMIVMPVYANAASISVSLSCPSTAKASATISCTVTAKASGSDLKGLQANIKVSNGTYSSFSVASGWTAYSNSASGFSVGRTSGTTSSVTVGTIKLKMPASGSLAVSLSSVSGSDSSYNTLSGNAPSSSVRVQSTINTLSSLKLSTGTLSPSFNANTTSYNATIAASSVIISATATDSKAKISGTGTKTLNYGTNTFNIVVSSESSSTKTYTIKITRPDGRSNNNNLKTLTTNQGTISFNKNTTNYNINVDSNITSIQIGATLEDTKASFVSGYGPRTVNLNYGTNKIEIKVKAENTSVKTYTINVTRKDNRSNNNYLKELTISNGKITFNKYTTEYATSVYYAVTKLDVTAVAEDSKATVVVNSPNLNVGNNEVTIVVKAENGSTKTYKIIVTRLDAHVKMSDNNNISELKILGHEIGFRSDKLEYDLTINEEYALVFEVALEDTNASYVIEGNEDLKDGSVIKVITNSESGEVKEYKFNIIKEIVNDNDDNSSNNNIIICACFGIIGFILGIVIALIITKSKKKSIDGN